MSYNLDALRESFQTGLSLDPANLMLGGAMLVILTTLACTRDPRRAMILSFPLSLAWTSVGWAPGQLVLIFSSIAYALVLFLPGLRMVANIRAKATELGDLSTLAAQGQAALRIRQERRLAKVQMRVSNDAIANTYKLADSKGIIEKYRNTRDENRAGHMADKDFEEIKMREMRHAALGRAMASVTLPTDIAERAEKALEDYRRRKREEEE